MSSSPSHYLQQGSDDMKSFKHLNIGQEFFSQGALWQKISETAARQLHKEFVHDESVVPKIKGLDAILKQADDRIDRENLTFLNRTQETAMVEACAKAMVDRVSAEQGVGEKLDTEEGYELIRVLMVEALSRMTPDGRREFTDTGNEFFADVIQDVEQIEKNTDAAMKILRKGDHE